MNEKLTKGNCEGREDSIRCRNDSFPNAHKEREGEREIRERNKSLPKRRKTKWGEEILPCSCFA